MFKNLIHLLYNSFGLSPWITLPILFLFFLTTISMIFIICMLLFDSIYRPACPTYPYNIILDWIIPITFIFLPCIIVFQLRNFSWLEKFQFALLIQIGFILPVITYWANQRNWKTNTIKTWNHPQLLLDIVIATIYPFFFCLLFQIFRYLRFGNPVDLNIYCNNNVFNITIISIFLLPYILAWLFLFILKFIFIKNFLWDHFIILIKSITVFLLKYPVFFYFLEKIHKFSFLIFTYIIHHPMIYRKPKTKLRYYIHYIFLHPFWIYLILLFLVILEAILFKGILYYTIQVLLIIIFFRPVLYFLVTFADHKTVWVDLCCYSNFIYKKWLNSYYPKRFWLDFENMNDKTLNSLQLDDQTLLHLRKKIIFPLIQRNRLLIKRDSYIYINVSRRNKISFYHKFIVVYRRWNKL